MNETTTQNFVGLLTLCKKLVRSALRFFLPDGLFLVVIYVIKQRRVPNLIRPTTFSAKVLCKMLFDRNELLPIIADKLAAREFVTERIGSDFLAKIYGIYNKETEIQLDDLPDKFVVKANHGSGFIYFVESGIDRDSDVIVSHAKKWLTTNYGTRYAEWSYKSIRPKLFAEEYLETEGDYFIDYKFYCFDGEPKYLKVLIGNKGHFDASRYFDFNWNTFEVAEAQPNFPRDFFPRPKLLVEMIEISKLLSAGFDFLRIDLYNIGDRIIFGEFTNYPNAGVERFHPREYDRRFGAYWNQDSMTYLPTTVPQALRMLLRRSTRLPS